MEAADVVVVGGGVAGASVAFSLARSGARVSVVDADIVGKATSAGAGIVQPWATSLSGPMYELYAAGAAHYPALVEQLAEVGVTDIGFRRTGSLVVDTDDRLLDEVSQRLEQRRDAAPLMGTVTCADAAQTRTWFPPLAEGFGGIHISGGARVDGRLLCSGLLAGVIRLGGTVINGTVLLRLHDGRIELVVDGRRASTGAIVVAGGAWSRTLLAAIDVPVDLAPQRGQIIHLRLDGVDTSEWPSINPIADHYMVAFDDSRLVVGATRETGSGFDPRVTAGGQHHVLTNALALAPGLRDATLIETRVGLRPMPPDGMPIIGQFDGLESLYIACGYGAIGLTIAPFCGHALSEMILTGIRAPALDPFAPVAARERVDGWSGRRNKRA